MITRARADSRLPSWLGARTLVAGMFLPLCVLLLLNLAHVLQYAAISLNYPFEIDYGEGIVWQQMKNIVAGNGYRPLEIYPAIVYHYPPVYHLTVSLTASTFGLDQLAAGRAVSLIATFIMAVMVAFLTSAVIGRSASRKIRWICGILSGLILLSCSPVIFWSNLMRVDMLCYAFTLAGLAMAVRSVDHPLIVVGAGLAFTLAIFTKQTSIAAPTATFLALAYLAPRQAALLLATCLAVGSAILGYLAWQTDGGFLEHILLYNINRLDPSRAIVLGSQLLIHSMLIVSGVIGALYAGRRLLSVHKDNRRAMLRENPDMQAKLILLIYLALTTSMAPMILKSGSNINYLIEWFCGLSIFSASAFCQLLRFAPAEGKRFPPVLVVLVLFGFPLQVAVISNWRIDKYRNEVSRHTSEARILVARIRQSPKPVISDDMILLIRAGRPVQWEPAITAELGQAGLYNEKAFSRMVRQGDFGFFLTRALRGDPLYDSRYNRVIADAMDTAYPRKIIFAGEVLHLKPRHSGFPNARPAAPAGAAVAR